MKKIFITTLLFFIALSVLADNYQAALEDLLKDQTFDLAYGIDMIKQPKPFNKFTAADIDGKPMYRIGSMYIEPDGYINPYGAWYKADFAEDPFNGLREIYVLGEPLPSASTTLLITLAVIAILLCCRDTKWKQLKTR
jgi:hypothetical protein